MYAYVGHESTCKPGSEHVYVSSMTLTFFNVSRAFPFFAILPPLVTRSIITVHPILSTPLPYGIVPVNNKPSTFPVTLEGPLVF